MSHCDNCVNIDRLMRLQDRAHDDRSEALDVLARVEGWNRGKGLLRFFFSLEDRDVIRDGALRVGRAADERIAQFKTDIEKAEKATVEGRVRHAEKKMAADIEKAVFTTPMALADRIESVKTLAEALDADLTFEDKLKATNFDDLSGVKTTTLINTEDGNNAELLSLYRQLSTPELKAHVEAALDAAVERGISMTVGDLAKKNVSIRLKKSPKTKR